MIGKLSGRIDSIADNHVIIDVSGVGYQLFCSRKTLARLTTSEHSQFLVETHVREDHIHLYGFANIEEKNTFNLLQSVKGVGTRMALNILSHLSPNEINIALAQQNKLAFNDVSGVGKKLAERIIIELKDKFNAELVEELPAGTMTAVADNSQGQIVKDATLALVNLGISRLDAQNRINNILAANKDASINELIRLALKQGA